MSDVSLSVVSPATVCGWEGFFVLFWEGGMLLAAVDINPC